MIKLCAVVTRKPEVERERLLRTWENEHAPFVAERLKPERYRLTFFDGQMGGGPPPFDGMATLWFDSLQAFDQAQAAAAEQPSDGFGDLLDPAGTFFLYTTEIVALDGPVSRETAKATFFVKRRDGVDEAEHFRHWRERHLPNVKAALERNPGGLRYAVSLADLGRPGPYAGVAELYWTDAKAMRAGLPGREADGFQEISEPYTGILGSEIAIVG